MIKRIFLLTLIFILSFSVPVLAAEPGDGVINGQLVNGTAGGSSVTDQTVTLTTYLNDASTGTSTSKTGADGFFSFVGLATGSGYSYEVTLTYQEADYTGERLNFADGETVKSTMLAVYDSTDSDTAIRISAAHTFVYLAEGGLEVVEYLVFTNDSDRSYVGAGEITTTGTKRTLKLPLPAKATGMEYGAELMSCCVLQGADGMSDTMAVLPGDKMLAYSYKVSYGSGSYKFSRKVDYPIAVYNFLVEGAATQVSSNKLVSGGLADIQGVQFNTLSGSNLVVGDVLVVELSGLPRSANVNSILWALGALVLLGGGGGFVYLMKKRSLQPVSVGDSSERLKQQLLLEMAELDDDFESGKIEREHYSRLRAEKKAQLLSLLQGSEKEIGRG